VTGAPASAFFRRRAQLLGSSLVIESNQHPVGNQGPDRNRATVRPIPRERRTRREWSDTMNATSPEMIAGGLLIVRVVIGILMMGHATQKLFGWLGGYGLRGTGGFFEQLGFRPGVVFAAAASLGELTSGLLVALGLFGPIGPALMISVMLVAMLTVHRSNGLFAATNGIEVPPLYATSALGVPQ